MKDEEGLPEDEVYVRCVESCDIPGEGTFKYIICMFKAMSHLLVDTKQPSIDTSFKRVHRWQEFEIEAWFPEYSRCKCTSCFNIVHLQINTYQPSSWRVPLQICKTERHTASCSIKSSLSLKQTLVAQFNFDIFME